MINSTYLYSLLTLLAFCFLFYFIFNYVFGKSETDNKLLLKKLLEGLDVELPDELKALESPPTNAQKYRNF